jgi:FMN-dependent NADH-azoreductase
MNILQINSSIYGDGGFSSQLAQRFVTQLERERGARVMVRDLSRDPIPHLDAARFGAFLAKPDDRTPAQQAVVDFSDRLIDEVRRADVIVLGVPMYNYGIPTQLKSWFDHIARAGVTFRYAESGPVGLLTGKRAFVLSTRGGFYAGTPRDAETPHVREFLALIGITDVEFIYAEGLSVGDGPRQAAIDDAHAAITKAAAQLPASAAATAA